MSKITVYGATGMVGSAIVREAVARGHSVVGVSRGGTPKTPVEGVRYVRGEIGDAADVVSKAQDCDIVVFAVPGPRDGSPVQPIIDAHAAIVDALAKAGVTARIFVVGGAGATLAADGTRLLDTPGFPDAYKPEARSFAEILEIYREAPESLDWVMLAPAPRSLPGRRPPAINSATTTRPAVSSRRAPSRRRRWTSWSIPRITASASRSPSGSSPVNGSQPAAAVESRLTRWEAASSTSSTSSRRSPMPRPSPSALISGQTGRVSVQYSRPTKIIGLIRSCWAA